MNETFRRVPLLMLHEIVLLLSMENGGILQLLHVRRLRTGNATWT